MRYEDAFARNIGLFSHSEQDRLRNATVIVAGVGGVGGIQAVTLARFGIGKMILIDPGAFDPPDMNRQYGRSVRPWREQGRMHRRAPQRRQSLPGRRLALRHTLPRHP